MVAPVVNLGLQVVANIHSIDNYGYSYSRYFERRHRYRQQKPFTLALPYLSEVVHVTSWVRSGGSPGISFDAANGVPFSGISYTHVLNDSYEKLRAEMYDRVQLGVAFAEHKQAISMIANAATTIARSYSAVRRLRFGDAAKILRMGTAPKGVAAHKAAGNNWLQYWFGWKPLVTDIYTGLEILTSPIKNYTYVKKQSRENFANVYVDPVDGKTRISSTGYVYAQQGARLALDYDGAALTLEQMGLNNPAAVAWELAPLSFVVDWFVNVGDVLNSLTDFAGLDLSGVFCTYGAKFNYVHTIDRNPHWYSSSVRDISYSYRTTSLSGVALEVLKIKPPSISRAVTAVSLLLQQMK
jgi:hypothetical protein